MAGNLSQMRRSVYEMVWEENAFGWVNLVRKLSLLTPIFTIHMPSSEQYLSLVLDFWDAYHEQGN